MSMCSVVRKTGSSETSVTGNGADKKLKLQMARHLKRMAPWERGIIQKLLDGSLEQSGALRAMNIVRKYNIHGRAGTRLRALIAHFEQEVPRG